MNNLVIAVDGPAGAGKSTIAKIIANKLNINYIDTGAMYRAITYKCLKNNIDVENAEEVVALAKSTEIDFKDNNIYLDKKIVNDEIRTVDVSNNVSKVSKIKEVRKLLVDVQRNIGSKSSVILDGRDIGSVVFPNADYKFYLIATPEERGCRRFKEMRKKGYDVNLDEIIKDIVDRDKMDMNRKFAPLVKAKDALEIDTTGKTIDDVVDEVVSKIKVYKNNNK
ncbi:(d)CMP kinase [Clostridioides mangenotii]|uniref:(d)CMP kinase n=1 Tax=Metaclostridioides mangenotii TaxID=1540 RepID=UPI001C10D33F|nr:(d)CMP kinase [Clostridioides mangenotii]MBU5306224.1 (d)CMP kinase [Clostridioides mangenotii]